MLSLSDLSRQESSTYTTTSQQEFDVPDSPTGHGEEKGFRRQQTHDGDRSPDVSDRRSHCFPENAGKLNTCSHLTECADGPNKGFCTPRSAQETRIRTAQSAGTQTCSRQNLPSGTVRYTRMRRATPKRMTVNDANNAALFLMG